MIYLQTIHTAEMTRKYRNFQLFALCIVGGYESISNWPEIDHRAGILLQHALPPLFDVHRPDDVTTSSSSP